MHFLSVQDFLRNNRGINDGGDLPEDFMSSLYERIQTNEIKMKVDADFLCVLCAGISSGHGWAQLQQL